MGSYSTGGKITSVIAGLLLCFSIPLPAQVIDFESNGLHFKTLTRNGLTIMFAPLPLHIRSYAILQVAISNGSSASWTVKPEDFVFLRADGVSLAALDAQVVVDSLMEKAGRADVIKLLTTYEGGVYGNPNFKTTTGYEMRRRNALGMFGSNRIQAAAAASAIVFVRTKLNPGESTDGALFFQTLGKSLGTGKMQVRAATELFEYDIVAPQK
jgi:hypothetical protein